MPFEDWFLPGQAPAGRSRSVHPRAEYDRPVRVTLPNTGAGDGEYTGEPGLLLAPDVALFAHQPLGIEPKERDPDKVLVAAVFE